MDVIGAIVLIVGAAAIGLLGQFAIRDARLSYEWVVTGVGALVGGYVASELIGAAGEWGPDAGGLFLGPALIGGLIVGGAVWLVTRNLVTAPAGRTS